MSANVTEGTEQRLRERELQDALAAIRRRKRDLGIGFLAFFPIAIGLTSALGKLGAPPAAVAFLALALWAVVMVPLNLRLSNSLCPLCGQRFFWSGALVNTWRTTCAGCGVRLDGKTGA